MLQSIRDNSQGIIAKIIIGFIILTFALFGIDAFFRDGGVEGVAEVNGEEISQAELDYGIELQKRRIQQQLGESFDPSTLEDSMLKDSVLDSLVLRQLLKAKANELGLRIPEAVIDQIIVSNEAFHENGKFSAQRYENLIRSNGLLASDHRNQRRTELQLQQLASGFTEGAFTTDKDLNIVARLTQERRDVRFLTVPVEKDLSKIDVSDEELQEYYAEHKDEFQSKEQVQLEFVELRLQDLFEEVSEAEVKATYEREIAAFEASEEREVAHILLEVNDERSEKQAKQQLQNLAELLQQGADFAELAEQHSEDVGTVDFGGNLGFVKRGDLPVEFEQAAQELAIDAVSEPVVTEAGVHLIKLLDVKKDEAPDFASSKARITEDIQKAQAKPEFVESFEALADSVFGADDLSVAAAELDLKVQQTEFFDRSGGEGIAAKPKVLSLVFDNEFIESRQNSDVLELDDDRAIVVRVKTHKPAAPLKLAAVKDEIDANIRQNKANSAAQAKAKTLLQKIEGGESIAKVAKDNELEWQVETKLERNSLTLDQEIVNSAFEARTFRNDVAIAQLQLADGSQVLMQVSNVQPGSVASLNSNERASIKGVLAQGQGSRELQAYFGQLRENADVKTF